MGTTSFCQKERRNQNVKYTSLGCMFLAWLMSLAQQWLLFVWTTQRVLGKARNASPGFGPPEFWHLKKGKELWVCGVRNVSSDSSLQLPEPPKLQPAPQTRKCSHRQQWKRGFETEKEEWAHVSWDSWDPWTLWRSVWQVQLWQEILIHWTKSSGSTLAEYTAPSSTIHSPQAQDKLFRFYFSLRFSKPCHFQEIYSQGANFYIIISSAFPLWKPLSIFGWHLMTCISRKR